MNHNEKVALLVSDLTARGIGKGAIAPPLFRLAWKFGVAIPPPHFLSFGAVATVTGTFFGVFWGAIMWLAIWSHQGQPFSRVVVLSLFAGVLFGVSMASYYRWKVRQLFLPSWREYGEKRG